MKETKKDLSHKTGPQAKIRTETLSNTKKGVNQMTGTFGK